jgi:4-alpha-glucanotransferase
VKRPAKGLGADTLGRLTPIRFGRAICGDLGQAERREWWLGNGRGGYASGTVALTLTRRYHGLLIAPVDPPLGRSLVLAKADATLMAGEHRYELFTNRWSGGSVAPPGHLLLESFHLDGTIPVWRFACDGRIVEHRIWMEPHADTTYLAWRLEDDTSGPPSYLSVSFLANGRDHHSETWAPGFNPEINAAGAQLTMSVPNRFGLHITGTGGEIAARREWYDNFDLPIERERGLGDRDSHLCIGEAMLPLVPGRWAGFVASLAPDASTDLDTALARRRLHDAAVLDRAIEAEPAFAEAPGWVRRLALATDLYVIDRPLPEVPDGRSVIAGYPWFGDWGRDTMISLPGLSLATGRFDVAQRLLMTFARFIDQGMCPNMFPGAGETPDYNTVDAALWYVEAWRAYVAATDDHASLRDAFSKLVEIVEYHQKGTRYGISVDPADGLVRAGAEGVQLTWMDARVGDWVVTPRRGKPVEINALWYNALIAMAELAGLARKPAAPYQQAAERVRAGFAKFVMPDGQGLYDVIDGPDGNDGRWRPNQIFAVSLPASPLDAATQRVVLDRCAGALVTSYGLRSLAPVSSEYRGRYGGGVVERDGAYHQGPVWGWLLGHWALAHYRVHGDAAAAQRWLEPIADHLLDAGLGHVSEIFDGDPPHTPRGCPAQAWSVACVLEAWWRIERARRGDKPAGEQSATAPSARRPRQAQPRS